MRIELHLPATHLTEYDKEEFRDVAHKVKPKITDEEFELAWAEFVEMKRKRSRN